VVKALVALCACELRLANLNCLLVCWWGLFLLIPSDVAACQASWHHADFSSPLDYMLAPGLLWRCWLQGRLERGR
jgi:hypothetical protein